MNRSLTDEQAKVLLELEMILNTVHVINSNLERSIDVVRERPPSSSQTSPESLAYRELVARNTASLKDVLSVLDQI
ncbi:hypothetical protein OXX69_002824 [Metschnikowia pulcherrima]